MCIAAPAHGGCATPFPLRIHVPGNSREHHTLARQAQYLHRANHFAQSIEAQRHTPC